MKLDLPSHFFPRVNIGRGRGPDLSCNQSSRLYVFLLPAKALPQSACASTIFPPLSRMTQSLLQDPILSHENTGLSITSTTTAVTEKKHCKSTAVTNFSPTLVLSSTGRACSCSELPTPTCTQLSHLHPKTSTIATRSWRRGPCRDRPPAP